MRVLVTGGGGFIGSHIVDQLLQSGHEPFVVDDLSSGDGENLPESVPLFEVDIRDHEELSRVFDQVRPHWVCHQAAQMSVSRSVREPAFDAEVNVMGLLHVLDLSAEYRAERIVLASSGGVLYGDVFEPAEEDHPADPVSPYGISKWAGERYLKFYAHEHDLKAVALRYANVYGPRQNPHGEAGVVAIFSRKMLAGEPAIINGDGKYVRDYVYATDVARANLLALGREIEGHFFALNVGTGRGTDVNELVAHMKEYAQTARQQAGFNPSIPEPRHGEPRPGDLRSSLVSYRRAHQMLGWQPQVELEEGLQQTVAWFAQQFR